MYRSRLILSVFAIAIVLSACATTAGSDARPRTSTTRISAAELAEMEGQAGNLYQVVSRLRPFWLQGDVVVYQNQSYFGWKQSLEEFSPDMAASLSYLDRSEAVAQLPGLGQRHIDGAIVIHTR